MAGNSHIPWTTFSKVKTVSRTSWYRSVPEPVPTPTPPVVTCHASNICQQFILLDKGIYFLETPMWHGIAALFTKWRKACVLPLNRLAITVFCFLQNDGISSFLKIVYLTPTFPPSWSSKLHIYMGFPSGFPSRHWVKADWLMSARWLHHVPLLHVWGQLTFLTTIFFTL